ncbi:transporter substrate-binding domain-containing protein [Pseudoxanthomonas sp. 10H]|uniref:transporter substrate-binding domain-containing protein n=1 Tax=Pseudoxanthomonas sp. 10H TaxID=3242729 RepID=UPI003556E1CB
MRKTTPSPAWLCAAMLLLQGCGGYPRDADRMSEHAAAYGMRVGASADPPWVHVDADGRVSGPEAELVQRYAAARGYRVHWIPGGHDTLMRQLEDAQLHAVIGGHHADTPWKPKVGWSQPLRLRAQDGDGPMPERRIALPPGQSAWHLALDRHLAQEAAR